VGNISDSERELRIRTIAAEIAKGTPKREILAMIGEKFGVKKKRGHWYALAVQAMAGDLPDASASRAEAVERLLSVYNKAREAGDLRTARQAAVDIARITGGELCPEGSGERVVRVEFGGWAKPEAPAAPKPV
jgi:hypothetical protein